MTAEPMETRLKRLKMRSMRRGIKEMDLILGAFSQSRLTTLTPQELDVYDVLLSENDQDLYAWVTGQMTPKPEFSALIATIALHARNMR